MLKKEEAIILRSAKSGNSGKLLTVLARDSGKIKLIAKGALKKESPFRGSLEPGSIVEAVYYFKENREIFFLKEVSLLHPISAGTPSLESLASRLAALELADQLCYPGDPDTRLWDLVTAYLQTGEAADPLVLLLSFEVKLLGVLGVLPEFDICAACGAAVTEGSYDPTNGVIYCPRETPGGGERVPLDSRMVERLSQMAGASFADLLPMQMSEGERKMFGLLLHWTYTYHVQGYRLPNSLKLLK